MPVTAQENVVLVDEHDNEIGSAEKLRAHLDGIVLWAHVGCDLWRAEAPSLREAFGLPVMLLDSHDVPAGGVREINRLTAFIESLQ